MGGGVAIIEKPDLPRQAKEALLILPGFGSKTEGIGDLKSYFSGHGYDLFIPDYIGRGSLAECVGNLDRFQKDHHLIEYRKLHVFAYILGGWTLNTWIRSHPTNNIVTIVYDRSPLQERAASVMLRDSPLLTRWAIGPVVEEFAKSPYPPIPNDQKNIGVVIESRATKLIRKHKKTALSLGPLNWDIAGTRQDYDDYFYTLNNHDDMYHEFKIIGREVLYFIKNREFSASVPRKRPVVDPFSEKAPG
jgi:hypothetical protein